MSVRKIKRRSLIAGAGAAGLLASGIGHNGGPALAVGIFDDPSNTSGLGAPAIIRGTVSTHNLSGLTPGSGMSTGVQQANATALQNAITYCQANKKFLEVVPNIMEINSSTGLTVAAGSGFSMKGDKSTSVITQFYNGGTGAPILSLGDPAGAQLSVYQEVDGISLLYGVDQTGLTASQPFITNNMAWSKFSRISIGQAGGHPGYNNFVIAANTCFSNSYEDITVNACQQTQMHITASGTGNVFKNIYLNNGASGTFNPLAGNYLFFDAGVVNEMTFIQLNCEWGATSNVINAQNTIGLRFIALHIEGIKLTGFSPSFFFVAGSAIGIDTLDFVDPVILSANISGGTTFPPSVVSDYAGGSSTFNINNFTWINDFSNQINLITEMFNESSVASPDDGSVFSVNSGILRDTTGQNTFQTNFAFDKHMTPTATAFIGPKRFQSYVWGEGGSFVWNAVTNISSTYTHYGQYQNAKLDVPNVISNFTITLAATMGATGNQAPLTGTVTEVHRVSGSSPSGTLLVKDDAGTTLTTNTTANQSLFYAFNGTHYVAITQVSFLLQQQENRLAEIEGRERRFAANLNWRQKQNVRLAYAIKVPYNDRKIAGLDDKPKMSAQGKAWLKQAERQMAAINDRLEARRVA